MNYSFDKKTFRTYFAIRAVLLLLLFILLFLLPVLIRWHFDLFDLYFFLTLYLFSLILDYFFITKVSKYSIFFLPCDNSSSPSLHLQKKHLIIYDVDYHLNSIWCVKYKWWGIIVRGNITADYNCDKELFKSKMKKRLVIPPYFSDMEEIAQRLMTYST